MSAEHNHPAVDHEGLAGDEAGGVARQEDHDGREIGVGVAEPAAEGNHVLLLVGILIVALGLGLIGFGALHRRSYVQLDGPRLLRSRGQRARWRFLTPTPADARVFAGIVRSRLADRPVADGRKVLPHDAF